MSKINRIRIIFAFFALVLAGTAFTSAYADGQYVRFQLYGVRPDQDNMGGDLFVTVYNDSDQPIDCSTQYNESSADSIVEFTVDAFSSYSMYAPVTVIPTYFSTCNYGSGIVGGTVEVDWSAENLGTRCVDNIDVVGWYLPTRDGDPGFNYEVTANSIAGEVEIQLLDKFNVVMSEVVKGSDDLHLYLHSTTPLYWAQLTCKSAYYGFAQTVYYGVRFPILMGEQQLVKKDHSKWADAELNLYCKIEIETESCEGNEAIFEGTVTSKKSVRVYMTWAGEQVNASILVDANVPTQFTGEALYSPKKLKLLIIRDSDGKTQKIVWKQPKAASTINGLIPLPGN